MAGTKARRQPLPSTTVHLARLRIFEASRRPLKRQGLIETSWGRLRLEGRLGQTHADVLEAICFSEFLHRQDSPDVLHLLVDPAEVRRRARQDGSTLKRLLDDLLSARIEIIEPKALACEGTLLSSVKPCADVDGVDLRRWDPLRHLPRPIWLVTLGRVMATLLQHDVGLRRDPRRLAQLRHGITQAIVRHVLSHSRLPADGWLLDGLIEAVAGKLSPQSLRDRRRELLSDMDALADFGLRLQQDPSNRWRLHVQQPSAGQRRPTAMQAWGAKPRRRGAKPRKRGATPRRVEQNRGGPVLSAMKEGRPLP